MPAVRRPSRRPYLALLAAAGLVGGGWYYRQRILAATRPPASVSPALAPGAPATARAERRDLAFAIEVTGDVTPAAQVEIKPEVSGRIVALHVKAGEQVRKGDVLVELDPRDLLTDQAAARVDIERARLTVAREQADFGRGEGLYKGKLASQETFDNVSNDLALAKNALIKTERALQSVEDKLSKLRVLSPTDGTVLTLPVVEGQVVTAAASVNSGTPLMTVADLSRLIVVTNVNQVDVAKVAVNQRVRLSMEALREPPMNATVYFIAPLATVKNNIKGFQVEANIEDPSPRLRPGMTVNLLIPIERARDAVSVPIAAVFNDGEGRNKVVYVKRGDETAKRSVKVGVTTFTHAQITEGLQEGEEVSLVPPGTTAAGKKS